MVKPAKKIKTDEEITSNLVSESLGLDNGNVVNNTLVRVEIVGEPTVVRSVSALTFRSTSQ